MENQKVNQKHIHIIGICGVATSAIAIAFKNSGWKVTGSDKGFFPPVSTELEKKGIAFYAGWHVDKMIADGKPDLVMIGGASGSTNPEAQYIKEQKIPYGTYPEILRDYFVKKNSLVAVGTWGKTSSSALLSFILDRAGFNPTYMFGGISLSHSLAHKASARLTDSSWNVFEGDEYKSGPDDPTAKFFYYKPTHLLMTAVSWDHADLYPTEADYFNAFEKLVGQIPQTGLIVACTDNAGVKKVLEKYNGYMISYGIESESSESDYIYSDVEQNKNGLTFVISHGETEYKIVSPLMGAFQAENITGCFVIAHQIGIAPEKIIAAIAEFQGLKRRLEKRLDGEKAGAASAKNSGVTVFDDIAHSPEKADSVLKNLREIYEGKITVVFEPNIGGRRPESAAKYDNAFAAADLVIIPRLTKLKVADSNKTTDTADQPFEGADLSRIISKTQPNTLYIEDDTELVKKLTTETKQGDVIAFLGSHGFRGMIEEIVEKLQK